MERKELVDSLVVREYREFADDPFGYAADRERCTAWLTGEGTEESDARDAFEGFESRYLVHDGGGLTLSAHGIDRAEALGEDVPLDDTAREEVLDSLHGHGGSATLEELVEGTGQDRRTVSHNVWILWRRGVVKTRTDVHTGERWVEASDDGA